MTMVPKSTTLYNLEGPLRTVFQYTYRFWQYKVYADIRGGSQGLCKFPDCMQRRYITEKLRIIHFLVNFSF